MAMRRWPVVISLVLAAAGCEFIAPAAVDRPAGGFECLGVPASMCSDYLDEARVRGPVAAIRIRCTSTTCTPAEGSVEITVWRPDGSVEQSGAGWMSPIEAPPVAPGEPPPDPTPPVVPACIGVPIRWCHQLAADTSATAGVFPLEAVVSITVRCTKICNAVTGEGTTVVVLDDGQRHEIGWGYDGVAP